MVCHKIWNLGPITLDAIIVGADVAITIWFVPFNVPSSSYFPYIFLLLPIIYFPLITQQQWLLPDFLCPS